MVKLVQRNSQDLQRLWSQLYEGFCLLIKVVFSLTDADEDACLLFLQAWNKVMSIVRLLKSVNCTDIQFTSCCFDERFFAFLDNDWILVTPLTVLNFNMDCFGIEKKQTSIDANWPLAFRRHGDMPITIKSPTEDGIPTSQNRLIQISHEFSFDDLQVFDGSQETVTNDSHCYEWH